MTTKKILCICDGGNVRSVAMAQYIKEQNKSEKRYEAIAIGLDTTSSETLDLLHNWANYIIDMREYFKDYWHDPRHPVLKKEVAKIWKTKKKQLNL